MMLACRYACCLQACMMLAGMHDARLRVDEFSLPFCCFGLWQRVVHTIWHRVGPGGCMQG